MFHPERSRRTIKLVSTLPIAAALVLTACAESGSPVGPVLPALPDLQIVDGYGLQVENGNVAITAQFGFTESGALSVDQYVGPGVNEDGKEIGWCQFGRWRNPAGRFTGSVPHAHCTRVVSAASQDVIEMEPISGRHSTLPGNIPVKLVFGNECLAAEYRVQYQETQNRTQKTGLLSLMRFATVSAPASSSSIWRSSESPARTF